MKLFTNIKIGGIIQLMQIFYIFCNNTNLIRGREDEKKLKTIMASAIVLGSIVTTSVTAVASGYLYYNSSQENGGIYTRGVTDPGNGYYMAFSYYHHSTKPHYSFAGDRTGKINYSLTVWSGTSCANGPSTSSTDKVIGYNF